MSTSELPPSASAMALREAFGDRKPPDITRKITACVACRKLKIRCHMEAAKPPCSRCRKRGLSCTVNRSLQQVLENEMTWRDGIEQRLRGYEDAFAKIATRISFPELISSLPEQQPEPDEAGAAQVLSSMSANVSPQEIVEQQQPQTWAVINDPRSGPAAIPASVVSEVSPTANFHPQPNGQDALNDLISLGVLHIGQAEKLFKAYQRMDQFLYTIIPGHDSLLHVRMSSSLLTAAICAVGALHIDPSIFPQCYRHFTSEASTHMFSRRHSLDDLRALCIGAFWLHDMSWALVGAAVRVAIEMNLHKTVVKLNPQSRDWYLRARLYCLVYVCDHHFSVAYGRPPLTREFNHALASQALLQCDFAVENDARLLSQVEIWSISTQVYDTFSIDTDMPIPDSLLPQLRRFGIALDTWHDDWIEKFMVNTQVGNYPHKGVGLHFHFAKLFLSSHAFRGAWQESSAYYDLSPELAKSANLAVKSATSILQVIVDDAEIQSHLNGVPNYFHTLIAFAVVFLVKVTAKESPVVRIDRNGTFALLDSLSTVLEMVTATMSKHHLLSSIGSSVRQVIEKGRPPSARQPSHHSMDGFGAPAQDFNWMVDPNETGFIGNFDFLNPPSGDFDFNFMDLNNG